MPSQSSHAKRSRPRVTGRRRHGSQESGATSSESKAVELLRAWIDEYAADRDPDLEEQLEELRRSRLSFRSRC